MNPKFQGWGYVPLLAMIGAFLVLRPLFDHFASGTEDQISHKTNVAVLILSGVISLVFVAQSDRRTGTKSFALSTWTTELGESHDITMFIPTRIVGVLLVAIGLALDAFR